MEEVGEGSEEHKNIVLCSIWDYLSVKANSTMSDKERALVVLLGGQLEELYPDVELHATHQLAKLSLQYKKEKERE